MLIDRVIAPFAAHDLACIERQKLVELRPGEENSALAAAEIVKAEDRAHRVGSVSDFGREVQLLALAPRSQAGLRLLPRRVMVAPFSLHSGFALSDIFREIDEELRRDNLQQLWSRYGKYVIGLAVLAVVATAAVMGWRAYQQHLREGEGVRYAAALDLARQGKSADAAEAFGELAQGSSGRAALARLEEAAAKIQAGDVDGGVALYDGLAANGAADPVFRDVATLLAARYGLEKGDPRAVVTRLQPLTNATSPWHGLALELTALAELKAGDTPKARADFDLLANDNSVSQGVRQRATEMRAAIAP